MASRLSLHVISPSPAIDTLIRSANWACVKSLGNTQPLQVARDAGVPIRVLRMYGVERLSPAGAVALWLGAALGYATHLQIVCEDARGYDPAWQLAVIDGLRGAGYAGRFLVGAFATGNPPTITGDPPHFPELEPLYPLLRRPDVDLACDAYTSLLIADPRWAAWAPYTVFRPTLIRADLARQGILVNVIVTESGGDNVAPVTTGGGWRTRDWSAEEYLTTLKAVDADDRAHPWLLARCLFTSGPTPDWAAYDIAPVAAQLATYVQTTANTTPQSSATAPTAPATVKEAPMTQGIDVSSLQPNTDWSQVGRSHQFAFIKATEGSGYTSPQFARDWAGAQAAGVIRGAYAFARPDLGNTPEAEADYFLSVVGPLLPGDLLALDLEVGDGDLSGWALAWLRRVEARVGFAPFLYTYPNFLLTRNLRTAALAAYPLWYASYQADWPAVPGQWATVALWQHSDNAIVPGVAGIVDESYSALTADELRALGKPAPAAPQGAPTMDEALTYYEQLGVKIDPTHGVYVYALKPLWDYYQAHKDDVVDGIAVGDLIKPGALIFPEYGAIWGNGRPAACVKLENRVVGVYQDTDGSWNHPYQARLA